MEVYFKIGEIAEMFDISVRTLHLYDKMGLFKPEHTDKNTGYRYYVADQIYKLNTIIGFKRIGFSLPEIKNMFDNNLQGVEIIHLLNNKAEYFRQQIDIAKYNIESIKRMKKSIEESTGIEVNEDISEQERARRMSKIICLQDIKFENFISEILWL